MSKGFFTNKNSKPTDVEIIDIVGKTKDNLELLIRYLTDELHLKGELKFYGINYGWALRFNKSGKSLISIYPHKDCLTVQIILNESQTDFALSSGFDSKIVQTIKNTEPIHEGKWVYLTVDERTEISAIKKLVDIRIKIK